MARRIAAEEPLAFELYYALGEKRSVRRAAEMFVKQYGGDLKRVMRRFTYWSRQYEWTRRVRERKLMEAQRNDIVVAENELTEAEVAAAVKRCRDRLIRAIEEEIIWATTLLKEGGLLSRVSQLRALVETLQELLSETFTRAATAAEAAQQQAAELQWLGLDEQQKGAEALRNAVNRFAARYTA